MAAIASAAIPANVHANKPAYWYTCCEKSDVEQSLQAGQTFDLHWLVKEDDDDESQKNRKDQVPEPETGVE